MSTGVRILYIEDDPGLSRLVRAKLEAEGYRVEIYATGQEGLAAFDEALHDLVIVDYQLPDSNGLQVLATLMARGATIPVIIATGAGSEEIAVRAMKLGAADYINKETYSKFFHLLPSLIEKTMRQHELARQKQRAETELRESEERLRSILASIDDAVLVTDKAGMFVAARAPARRAGRPRPRGTGSGPRSATSSPPRSRPISRLHSPRCRRMTGWSSSTTRCRPTARTPGSTPRCRR